MHVCPRCQSDRLVKNGSAAGKPKKQCQQCDYQFTRTTPRGKPLSTKINAVLWYLSGMSMNRIAFLLHVSAQAVLTWIRDLARDYYEKPEPTGRTIVLQPTFKGSESPSRFFGLRAWHTTRSQGPVPHRP